MHFMRWVIKNEKDVIIFFLFCYNKFYKSVIFYKSTIFNKKVKKLFYWNLINMKLLIFFIIWITKNVQKWPIKHFFLQFINIVLEFIGLLTNTEKLAMVEIEIPDENREEKSVGYLIADFNYSNAHIKRLRDFINRHRKCWGFTKVR